MRVLVTGAAGFIGSHLCDALLSAGHEVTGLDNFASGKKENLSSALAHPRFRLVEGSILDSNLLEKNCREMEIIFHLAVECVRLSLGRPLENHEINATGTLVTLEAARRARVRRYVYCSSSEVYGNTRDRILSEEKTLPEPVTVYGAAKLAGEHYAKAYYRTYGMDTVIVRPFNTYGPREHHEGMLAELIPKFILRALNGKAPLVYGDGKNARDFTYISDTVRGILAAAEWAEKSPACIFNIAYGRAFTVNEIASVILKMTGAKDLCPLYLDPRPGDVLRLEADTRLSKKILKYRAEIRLEEGLKKTIQWFRDRYPDPSVLLEKDVEKAWEEIKS